MSEPVKFKSIDEAIEAYVNTRDELRAKQQAFKMEEDAMKCSICLFTSMEGVRFRRQVVPGDRLDLHCELIRQKLRLWKIRGTALVDGVLAAEAELTAAIMPKEEA